MKLRGQVAVVTGGSRGLGREIAARLVEQGADLVLGAREAGPLDETGQELLAHRVHADQRIVWQSGDISQAPDVEQLMQLTDTTFGRLDVLVCNAGVYGPLGTLETVDWIEWVRAVEINLYGTVLSCRSALPIMRRGARGKIIVLSGGGATQPLPRISAYATSKAAVVRFAETLAEELAGTGIDVNAVAPGALNTRLLDQVLAAGAERVGEAFYTRALRQQQEGGTPLQRGAQLVEFLATSDSDGITGRLLSAVWDDWANLPYLRNRLATSDVYTLRRVVPADRGWEQP